MKKILLLAACLSMGFPAFTDAQTKVKDKGHYVKMKPKTPKYTRVTSPGTNYTYVKEDWTWNTTTSAWDWNGNRYVEVTTGKTWVPGHWVHSSMGYDWVEGYWR